MKNKGESIEGKINHKTFYFSKYAASVRSWRSPFYVFLASSLLETDAGRGNSCAGEKLVSLPTDMAAEAPVAGSECKNNSLKCSKDISRMSWIIS